MRSLACLLGLLSVTTAKDNVADSISSAISAAPDAASAAASSASVAAWSRYSEVANLVSELVSGKEPSFTDSVLSRFSQIYPTGDLLSSASSLASVASSQISASIPEVTLPVELDSIFHAVDSQVQAAIAAASIQFYGSKKGVVEAASSSASSAYDEASKTISSMVYGTTNYHELASSSIAAAASSASSALSAAIYGTQAGYLDAAASVYSSATAAAGEQIASVSSQASSAASGASKSAVSAASSASKAIYGPEHGTFESATARLAKAIESAQAALLDYANDMGEAAEKRASEALSSVSSVGSVVGEKASSAASSVSSVAAGVKDEL